MQNPRITSKQEWLTARLALLEKEKAFNRQRDELTRERQLLPWVKIDKQYSFDGPDGELSFADAFGRCSQLIVYHFMYHPSWNEGCVSCSFWADNFNGIITHLNARDVAMVVVSTASINQLTEYKNRLGWSFNWLSSLNSDFCKDFHVSFDESQKVDKEVYYNYRLQNFPSQEAPGVSVFAKDKHGDIFHTYSTYSRGLDMLNGAYHYLDIVPKGRDEKELEWSMACIDRSSQITRWQM